MKHGSSHILVNGIRLHVHRFQPASTQWSGLSVVLVHGFMDAGATWDWVAEKLARAGHQVFAPDMRGFGESDPIGAGGYYHFPDYVGDLAALIEHLECPRLALVGHSMGGTIASLYAGTFPNRIERLALLEGIGTIHAEPSTAVNRMRAWLTDVKGIDRNRRQLASFDEALDRLARTYPDIPRDVLESRARLLTRTDSGQLSWAYDPLHRTTSPTPFNVDAFKSFLSNIAVPTLFVTGGTSGWRVPDESERLACIANVEHVDIPDAGHMMHWKTPNALTDCLLRFLAS